MQTYILDSKNEDKIYRIKQALLNLDRWDFVEGPIEVPIGGYVEPFPGQHFTLWGCLSWTHHWIIRPANKKNLLHYSNIGQCRTGRHRRRTPLSKLFKLNHYDDYLLGIDYNRVTKEDWLPYVKDYLDKLRKERELRHPSYVFLFPTDKDVEELLVRVATFTHAVPASDPL